MMFPPFSCLNVFTTNLYPPTGNLDSKTSADVLGLLKRTSMEFNQTIVMITHNNEIAQLADRIVRIEDGRIAGGGQVRKGGGRL